MTIICVTGTNGKTTTCAMIEQGMKNAGKSYFVNKSGANMISGVATAFINNSTITGRPKCKYAILECDENSLPEISRYINAEIVVVTNVFRDQLDRYGEVSTTLKKIKQGIDNFPNSILVLNADCPLTFSLAHSCANRSITFGINHSFENKMVSDSPYCPICSNLLRYKSVVYSQLGDFYCTSCGFKRSAPNLCADSVSETSFIMENKKITLSLAGVYNIYNYLASVLVLKILGVAYDSVHMFDGAFGRMEHFKYKNKNITLLLVKNPVGYSNCIEYARSLSGRYNIVFALNDKEADGRDVSWIWDISFRELSGSIATAYSTGIRAYDMALRLKYDGIKSVVLNGECYSNLIDVIKKSRFDTVVFTTYTSMMSMRHYFIKEFGGEEFWK